MASPRTTVKNWQVIYKSDFVTVESSSPDESFFRTTISGDAPVHFFGQTAREDARRLAAGVDFKAWGIW
jgi:hypothetical protein